MLSLVPNLGAWVEQEDCCPQLSLALKQGIRGVYPPLVAEQFDRQPFRHGLLFDMDR